MPSPASCLIVLCAIFGIHLASPVSQPQISTFPLLLVVSFDGFRYDYLNKTSTPNFDRLISDGVTVPWIEARFITKTFPNHHSIATGVYEETHGIVANSFYDPVLNDTFKNYYTGPEWWDMGPVPIYTLNQMASLDQHSGGMMWIGTNAWIKNQTCDVFVPYNESAEWVWRVDTVINWFNDPVTPVNCVYLYFENPDSTAHDFGPDSPEVVEQIQRADNITGYLRQRLEEVGLWDKISLIVTSDHGMSSVPASNAIIMSDFIDITSFQYYGSSPVFNVQANDPADNDALYDKFYEASLTRAFEVYKKEDIPDIYHYQDNRRILPILVVANEHWDIVPSSYNPTNPVSGNHGYNNSLTDMHPFFIAHGPQFKVGFRGDTFRNIDIYPLAACLLGLQPAPNNGTFQNVSQLLANTTLIDYCSNQLHMINNYYPNDK